MQRNPSVSVLIAQSGVTVAVLQGAISLVIDKYRELGPLLPAGHAWREGKLKHALQAGEEARMLGQQLGMNELETTVLEFLLVSHDIGRLVEGARTVDGQKVAWGHGVDSVIVLRGMFFERDNPKFGSLAFWGACLAAIEHHADINEPELEPAAYALYSIVSDLDKIAGFEKASAYVDDEAQKRSQIQANWKQVRESDPMAGEEHRAILPASQLDQFERRQQLIRSECRSYEAFMLQLMAWFFGVKNPEIYPLIVATGGPQILMEYFRRQLSAEEYGRIAAVVRTFGVAC